MIKMENAEVGPNRARPIRFGHIASASPRAFQSQGGRQNEIPRAGG